MYVCMYVFVCLYVPYRYIVGIYVYACTYICTQMILVDKGLVKARWYHVILGSSPKLEWLTEVVNSTYFTVLMSECIHMYTQIYTCVHMYTCVHTYIHTYTHTLSSLLVCTHVLRFKSCCCIHT